MKPVLSVFFVCALAFCACKKQNEWLDAKRQITDNVPETLKDFQAILDNSIIMNAGYPTLGLLGADNYYFPDAAVQVINAMDRNSYLWNKDIFGVEASIEYNTAYNIIASANVVLEGVAAIDIATDKLAEYNNVKGQALFFRSMLFSELAAVFCKHYNASTAANDLGICIRTKSDVHHLEPRSSIEQTYKLIIDDLKLAASLLPVTAVYKTRPCKSAAFALLARTYLQMGSYTNAKSFSDSALTYSARLLDFNDEIISITKPYRFPDFKLENPEIVFYATGYPHAGIAPSASFNRSFVDSLLFQSYDDNDLRKTYFFATDNVGRAKYRGGYTGNDLIFDGIGINEVFLIRAECNARMNNIVSATDDLNKLLKNRYKKGAYTDFVATDGDVALVKILEERRKELPFTGQIRWQDLRRLNKEPRFARVLKRLYNGTLYEIQPNDKRYIYPFPQNEIDLAGIQQNER
ncbi:RagB/SusD family nutrient uptake outer membrane protein [Chitinophaga niabensis]|uniref:SusD family protein n=1 Tax=Chitinophaga niabensis TaxID=536979 RepID=A0A1N6K9Z3_9BACT|nr:RagB/SusD family nutrient uptake outer membrane protein [Chitinophaga niabensis]SIO53273.1 SusD family protein [Chitinophaga niabensis]